MDIIEEVIEAKKNAEAAKKAYYESFKKAISSIVEETMKKVGYDGSEEMSYNFEILTEEQSLYASEESFRLSQRKERKLKEILKECEGKLYDIIEDIHVEATIKVSLYNNNDIGFEVCIDDREYEWFFDNKYNKK